MSVDSLKQKTLSSKDKVKTNQKQETKQIKNLVLTNEPVGKWVDSFDENKTLYFCSRLALESFTSLLRRFSNSKQKTLKNTFGNKHLKLIISNGRSSFGHSIWFLYGNSVVGYIKRFFHAIGRYFMKNQ